MRSIHHSQYYCQSVDDRMRLGMEVDLLHSANGLYCVHDGNVTALLAHRFLLPRCLIQLSKLLIGLRAASFGTRQVKNRETSATEQMPRGGRH